jgi:hypothetical protein
MLARVFLLFLVLAAPVWADQSHKFVAIDIQVAARLGDRRMVAQPKLKVASEQEASIVIADEEQARFELSVTPRIEGDRIRLVIKVLATDGERRLQRTFQYVSIAGEAAQFSDEDANESLTLVVTPSFAD